MLTTCSKDGGFELQLVFVASCHSENVGKIFHNAGVKHVICIREKQKISDEATITFSNSFYKNLFKGNSICQAFKLAQDVITNNQICIFEFF